jgi:spermidine synthase
MRTDSEADPETDPFVNPPLEGWTGAALSIFFLSGFAALLYQVVWQRLLVIFSGADVYSVTIIVAAFMAGLGVGNLSGGYLADRLSIRANLFLFAGAEAAIGAFGLLSKTIYYDVLYVRLSQLASFPAVAIVLFLSLLWPTFFMGLSLPILARALTRTASAAGRRVGSLYGWNTLGAACGALATPWWLLPRFGLEDSIWIGAAINFVCACGAAYLAWGQGRGQSPEQPIVGRPYHVGTDAYGEAAVRGDVLLEPALPFGVWALVYGVTGFCALALEIAWFRLLGVMLKSTAFTFGTLMAVYLAGLGAGAALAAPLVGRSRRPGTTFLTAQVVLIVFAGLSVVALVAALKHGRPAALAAHLFGGEPYDIFYAVAAIGEVVAGRAVEEHWQTLREFLILYAGLPIGLIGVPTFLMGFSFPYLQRATQVDSSRIGRRVGLLMTSSIVGNVLGATLAGWFLLPVFGTPATFRVVVAIGGLLSIPLAKHLARGGSRRGRAVGVAFTGLAVLTLAFIPTETRFWATVHGAPVDRMMVAEDGSGLSVLKSAAPNLRGQTFVFVSGLSQSWIPYGNVHTVLGALPALLHENPEDVAIIGLGSGDTAFAAAGRSSVRRIVCIEIIGAQKGTLERYARLSPDPGLVALLSDPRIEHVVGDGRTFIARSNRRFDIIEADALRPSSAYSGNLYSKEYFELLARHLKPGGLAVTWAPTGRVRATFVKVFPHVLAFGPDILIGSNDPVAFERDPIMARLTSAHVRNYFGRAGVDIERFLADYLADVQVIGADLDRAALQDINTDLFPRDEYNLPRVLPF